MSLFGYTLGLLIDFLIGIAGGYLSEKGRRSLFFAMVIFLILLFVYLVVAYRNEIRPNEWDVPYIALCFISTWLGFELGSRVARC